MFTDRWLKKMYYVHAREYRSASLLLKEILRHTPKDHPDVQLLEKAVSNPRSGSCALPVCMLACLRKIYSDPLTASAC